MKLNSLRCYAILICTWVTINLAQKNGMPPLNLVQEHPFSNFTPGSNSDSQADPFIAAVLGAIPLSSGFYLTSAPQKGLVFTLADLVLIGTVISIRRDTTVSQKDIPMYYGLIAAVNLADIVFSVMQVKSDEATRIKLTLNPLDQPGFKLAWQF